MLLFIPSSKPIFWVEGKVYALGVWFSTSRPANNDNNFTEKIEKIKKNPRELVGHKTHTYG